MCKKICSLASFRRALKFFGRAQLWNLCAIDTVTARCCEARFGNPWYTDTVLSQTSPPKRTSCGVVQSRGLCFTSLALLGTRGISLTGTTPRGVTFYGLSAERAATRFIFSWNPCVVSVPLEGRDGLNRVGRSSSPHALGLMAPRRES